MFSGEEKDHFTVRLKRYNEIRKELAIQGKSNEEVASEIDRLIEIDRKAFEGRRKAGVSGGSAKMSQVSEQEKRAAEDKKGVENKHDGRQHSPIDGAMTKLEELKVARGKISDSQLERLDKLKHWYLESYRPSDVSNPLMQSGLKQFEVTDRFKEDATNVYSRPAFNTLLKWNREPVSQSIATAEEVAQITSKLEAMGMPTERVRDAILDSVLYAAHNSSSPFQKFEGDVDFRDPKFLQTFSRASVASIIKEHSTIRKICRLFAPIVWSYMIINDEPPANWQAKGYPESAKFASFDTFDFVCNHAAMKPLEGLVRLPTDVEKLAHEVQKTIALDKSRRNEKLLNTSSKVSGGQQAGEIRTEFKGNGSSN